MSLSYSLLRPAKTDEITPEAQAGFLSSFLSIGTRSFINRLLRRQAVSLSFEIVSTHQQTQFYLVSSEEYGNYFTSQILSQYPKTLIESSQDPLVSFVSDSDTVKLGYLSQSFSFYFPLSTFRDPHEIPPLAGVMGFFAKLSQDQSAFVQCCIRVPQQSSYQHAMRKAMSSTDKEGNEKRHDYASLIEKKSQSPLLEVQVRIGVKASSLAVAQSKFHELAGSFGGFTLAQGNSLHHAAVSKLLRKGYLKHLVERTFYVWHPTLVLNLDEMASLWHLPDKRFENITLIHWGKQLVFDPPDNLPVAEAMSDEEKAHNNFFAKTEWRNHEAIFGIKKTDRRRHMYIIGKTGAGKSTLIANMAINDIRNGEGVAVIDPHGDLTEALLDYIPKRRINDVIYLDPTVSNERAFSLNLFDTSGSEYMDVVASGIVAIFQKLYAHSWGPRLEYILRNAIISLLHYEQATFADLPRILTNDAFRDKVIKVLEPKDPILTSFWKDEYNMMNERLRTDSISSILNKVGQFLSSTFIRNVIDVSTSSFSLADVMNQKKILLVNLSQGKIGEDTAALLGAMFITKIQLAAMQRVFMAESDRVDFYLYVDEFQNFATGSFIKILSEARKYRLNLTLANQYIAQVDEGIQKAIFGNVGTLLTFVVGANDADQLTREFGGQFEANDLVGLGKYEVLMKMAIDDLTSSPFIAKTLPPPSVVNNNRDKIIRVSTERYYRKVSAFG